MMGAQYPQAPPPLLYIIMHIAHFYLVITPVVCLVGCPLSGGQTDDSGAGGSTDDSGAGYRFYARDREVL